MQKIRRHFSHLRWFWILTMLSRESWAPSSPRLKRESRRELFLGKTETNFRTFRANRDENMSQLGEREGFRRSTGWKVCYYDCRMGNNIKNESWRVKKELEWKAKKYDAQQYLCKALRKCRKSTPQSELVRQSREKDGNKPFKFRCGNPFPS